MLIFFRDTFQILGLNSFSLENVVAVDPTIMEKDESDEVDHGHSHEHGHCNDDSCVRTESDFSNGKNEGTHHDHAHEHERENEDKKPAPSLKKKRHNLSLVSSVGYTIKGLLDIPRFNQFMSQLLSTNAANIYRSKGVLAFDGQGDVKFVFQGVHEQVNFGPSEKPWAEGEERVSKLVFIGKNLEPEVLKERITSCTVDPSAALVTMHKRKE